MSVILWQNGLAPAIQCLQLADKPVTSLREAVDRARRHEAASLVGGTTVSAKSFTHVPNRSAVTQFNNNNRQQQSTHRPSSSTAHHGVSPSTSNKKAKKVNHKERPKCTWEKCNNNSVNARKPQSSRSKKTATTAVRVTDVAQLLPRL